jgi:hypothetical protein
MDIVAYPAFIAVSSILGALLGVAGHWCRANFSPFPEKVLDDWPGKQLNLLVDDGYVQERDVWKAKWNDGGWWEYYSLHNLAYYVLSGAIAPIIIGAYYWDERRIVLGKACSLLGSIGAKALFCS